MEHAENSPVIMIVDDDPFIRKILSRVLASLDCELLVASSGPEALALAHTRRPDLILMDYAMPEMNGVEVARKLKALEAFAEIPIILLTGQEAKRVAEISLDAGVADIVEKPFVRAKLLEKIRAHIGGL